MTTALKALQLIALLCLLSACSQLEQMVYGDDPLTYIDSLVAEDRFDQALQFIGQLPPEQQSQEVMKKRLRKLQLQAVAYEKGQVDRARQFAKQQDWVAALELLEEALDNYRNGELLQQTQKDILALQRADLEKQWQAFNRQQGEHLPRLIEQIDRIIAAGDDSRRAEEIRDFYHDQASELAEYFSIEAQRQVRKKQWRLALTYFQLADALLEKPRHQGSIITIQKRLMSQKVAGMSGRQMLDKIDQHLEKGELLAAQRSLEVIQDLHPDEDVTQRREALRELIDVRVQKLIHQGREHYARGELDAAISLWRQGLILKPDEGELVQLLARAEAFKAHYEKLREAK